MIWLWAWLSGWFNEEPKTKWLYLYRAKGPRKVRHNW